MGAAEVSVGVMHLVSGAWSTASWSPDSEVRAMAGYSGRGVKGADSVPSARIWKDAVSFKASLMEGYSGRSVERMISSAAGGEETGLRAPSKTRPTF